jgi:hypothetical protein
MDQQEPLDLSKEREKKAFFLSKLSIAVVFPAGPYVLQLYIVKAIKGFYVCPYQDSTLGPRIEPLGYSYSFLEALPKNSQ